MKTRIKTGTMIGLVTCLAIFAKLLPLGIGDYIFDIFVMSIAIVAGYEITNIFKGIGRETEPIMVLVYTVLNYLLTIILINYVSLSVLILVHLLTLSLYFGVIYLVAYIKNKYKVANNFAVSVNTSLACLYPSFFFCLMIIVNHSDMLAGVKYFSFVFIAFIFIVTMLTDTFAYFVGMKLRGKKLAPTISPNKTISGAIGGLFGGVVGAALLYLIVYLTPVLHTILTMYSLSIWLFLILGLVCSILGQIGDLLESKLKRMADVKDSGNLFPGHGGMLDRIDAMIFVATFVFACVILIIG